MRSAILLVATIVTSVLGQSDFAQAQYYRNYGYGGYGRYGYGGMGYGMGYGMGGIGMTPGMGYGIGMGAEASGMGNFAAGLGQFQESHEKANISHQQAVEQYLKNQSAANDLRFKFHEQLEKQHEARVANDADLRKRVDEHIRQLEQMEAPHRLTEDQFDRTHSIIHWPFVLRTGEYAETRFELDKLFHARTPTDSGENSANAAAISKACDDLLELVKTNIHKLDVNEYVTAKHFIASLAYEAKFPLK